MTEITDLYLHPPPGSVVLSIDEKTGMQALERRFPDRPARPGHPARREFEYIRHGTQSLFCSFEVHNGRVIERCGPTRTGAKPDDSAPSLRRSSMKRKGWISEKVVNAEKLGHRSGFGINSLGGEKGVPEPLMSPREELVQ